MPQAEVDAGSERKVMVGSALDIEALGILVRLWVHVGGHQHGHDSFALLKPHAVELHIAPHDAGLGKLHWSNEAQKLLDGERQTAPVLLEPGAQTRILEALVNRAADEVR